MKSNSSSQYVLKPSCGVDTAQLLWKLTPLLGAITLSGCAVKDVFIPPERGLIPPPLFAAPEQQRDTRVLQGDAPVRSERTLQVADAPAVPKGGVSSNIKPPAPKAQDGEPADTTLAFDQLPLPNFIQVVFGQVLKKNFSMDPSLAARTDLVTIRTPSPSTKTQVLEVARMLLKSYGVSVQEMGGFYRIGPDTNQSAYLPEIRRGRAQPEVPLPLRPVFSLVEMTAVRNSDVSRWLTAMFGTRIKMQEDPARNALLISGEPADLTAALEAIQILDQPLMRGQSSQLISPASLGAEDLTRRLTEILSAEGYAVGSVGAVSLVAIPSSNTLLVFAADPAVLAHVREWAQKLDAMDNNNRRVGNYFSYEVKYADAQSVAKTMQELMSVQSSVVQESQQVAPGTRVIGAPTNRQTGGRIVVNPATNTLIIYTANPEDQAQLLGVLRSIDRPAKSALIEVTVAEVRTGDKQDLGIEWGMGPRSVGDGTVSGGTLGGSVISNTGGLNLSFLNSAGVVRAKLNALASDSRARILSSPRIMARNGEAATIQVGEEVPIITSQQTTSATATTGTTTTPTILQQIQYKNTGVLLKVKPIIYAGNRVEIDVQQEVSSAGETKTGVNNTPTFTTRKIDTKLSIRDGATVALGGLISSSQTGGAGGVPLLKDIPLAGQLFRADTQKNDQTELIVLITPYVVDNDMVADQVTQAMRAQLGEWAKTVPAAKTLERPAERSSYVDVMQAPGDVGGASRPATVVGPGGAASAPSGSTRPMDAALGPTSPPHSVRAAEPSLSSGRGSEEPAVTAPGADALPRIVMPPGGRPVTDPVLLEEVRRANAAKRDAAQGKPNTGPAVPSTTGSDRKVPGIDDKSKKRSDPPAPSR